MPVAAARPASRRSSRKAARLASAGDVGAPWGRCGWARWARSRRRPAVDSLPAGAGAWASTERGTLLVARAVRTWATGSG